ncbi:MAG TPA: pitrilysin family protein, partial [Thermoanaerobaculia bacterium]
MRSLRQSAIAAAAALCTLATPALAQVQSYRDIKTPALRQFQMPQPKRIELPNGLVIFLQEDRELPLIRGSVTIRGGGRDVPAEKAGLTGILGQAWRTGGTATRTGDQLDEQLESRAAVLETSADTDSMTVRLNVLKQDLDFVFPIWVDLIRNPAFRQEKIDLAKTQLNTAISRRNDEPMQIALREAAKLAYGASSPYTRQAEYSTVAGVTRQDLLDFHKRFVHPNNMIIGFVGDFDSAKLEKQLRDTFGSLPRGPQAPKPDQSMNPSKPGVYLISKSDVNQSNIVLTHPGTIRNVPEYYSLLVMNEILSGGFSGRLMNDLRTARGLAYGVSGGVGSEWDRPGLFRLWIGTKSGSTMEAIEALR